MENRPDLLIAELLHDLDPARIAVTLVTHLTGLAGAASAALYLPLGNEWRCVYATGRELGAATGASAPLPADSPLLRPLFAGEPIAIADTSQDPEWRAIRPARPGGETIGGWAAWPLTAGRLLAIVDVGYPTAHQAPKDMEAMDRYLRAAGPALRQALLLDETAARERAQTLRASLGASLLRAGSLHALLERAVDEIGRALNVSLCMAVVRPGGGGARVVACYQNEDNAERKHLAAAFLPLVEGLSRSERVAVIDLARGEAGVSVLDARRELLLGLDARSVLAVPIRGDNAASGVLALVQAGTARTWSPGDVVVVEAIGADLGVAIGHMGALEDARVAAARIAAERDMLRAAIERLPLGVVITPARSGETLVNRAARPWIEEASAPLSGVPLRMILPDGSRGNDGGALLRHVLDEGTAVAPEDVLLWDGDGRTMPAALAAYPLRGGSGDLDAALAVVRDRSEEQRTRHRLARVDERLGALDALARALTADVPLRDLLDTASTHARTLVPFDALTLTAIDDARATLERMASIGATSESVPEDEQILLADTVLAPVFEHGVPLVVRDLALHQAPGARAAAAAGMRSALSVPITSGTGVVASLNLMRRDADAFGDEDAATAARVANLLGLVIERERAGARGRERAVRAERERLAREIHDTLAQTITGVVMELDSAAHALTVDDAQRQRLEHARDMARAALAEARRSVWSLRAASAELQAPRLIIQEEIAAFARRSHIAADLVSVGEARQVEPEIGSVLQRAVREALDNVSVHSGASQARLALDYGLQMLTILIEDDGQGFDPDTVDLGGASRVGLAGVADRARAVGGALHIESAPGQGTRVRIDLPYAPAPAVRSVAMAAPAPDLPAATPAATGELIRVLLIDDHAMVREGLMRILQEQPDLQVVGAEATGTEGLRRIAELQPDVVLCDLQLPDISGVDVIARAQAHYPNVRCLVVTTYDSDDYIYEGIKAGAKGYVLKDVSAQDLMAAVRAAARDESLLQPVVARKLVERFADLARQGSMVEPLTEREVEVLTALASGARNKEIAFDLGLSESTIKTHLASIFGKLGVTTRTEAVARGRELGLIAL